MKKRGLLRSTALVSSNTMISRILGFVRDMIVAHVFGATAAADAFYVAFKLPNFMRGLFAEGSFSQAFVPVLSEYQTKRSREETKVFIDRICGSLIAILLPFTFLLIIFSPFIVYLFAPGYAHDPLRYDLASHMLRITFPYLFFISLTALCSAILNTYSIYGVPAFTPVWLNICMIVAAVWLSQYFAIPVYGLAWGVFLAGIVQLIFQIPFLAREKLLPTPRVAFYDPGVRRVLKLMVPALFGVSVSQINLLLSTVFASFLTVGSISWLYYSDRLMNFPLGVFGVAIATVILPHLSRHSVSGHHENYSKTLDWSIRMLLLIGLPSSIGLMFFSGPLFTSLLAYGKYQLHDVIMSQHSLIAYAFGVQAFMLIKVFASGFYARQNIKTPVKIGIIAMLSNIVLNLILVFPLKHVGLALGTSLAAYVNAGLLFILLLKYEIFQPQPGWLKFGIQLLVANFAVAIFLFFAAGHPIDWMSHGWQWRLIHLFIDLLLAIFIYFILLFLSGIRLQDLRLKI